MTYVVRCAAAAEEDVDRLLDLLVDRAETHDLLADGSRSAVSAQLSPR